MIRHHDRLFGKQFPLAANFAQRFERTSAKQALHRGRTKRHDHLRIHDLELRLEVWQQ